MKWFYQNAGLYLVFLLGCPYLSLHMLQTNKMVPFSCLAEKPRTENEAQWTVRFPVCHRRPVEELKSKIQKWNYSILKKKIVCFHFLWCQIFPVQPFFVCGIFTQYIWLATTALNCILSHNFQIKIGKWIFQSFKVTT